LCKSNANELARFAEALPSLSNQAQDEYQRLTNNKSPKSKRKKKNSIMVFLSAFWAQNNAELTAFSP